MKIKVNFNNNELPDKYGKYAGAENMYKDQPILSFPFTIVDAPADTQYFCFTLIDHDAIPVCGFSWIHWTVANVAVSCTDIPENYSQVDLGDKIQGTNSFASALMQETDPIITQRYVGPTPPDGDHNYTLTVYALSAAVNLREGFYLNELYRSMKGKVLEQTSIEVIGKK